MTLPTQGITLTEIPDAGSSEAGILQEEISISSVHEGISLKLVAGTETRSSDGHNPGFHYQPDAIGIQIEVSCPDDCSFSKSATPGFLILMKGKTLTRNN